MKDKWTPLAVLIAATAVGCGLGGCGRDTAPDDWEQLRLPLLQRLERGAIYPGVVDPGAAACRGLRQGAWSPPERRTDGGTHAWTLAEEARLQLPVDRPGAGCLVLQGYGLADAEGPRRLEIVVNGSSLGEQTLPASLGQCSWNVPQHKLRQGLNDIRLRVDRVVRPADAGRGTDNRTLGVLVDWLQFVPDGQLVRPDPYDEPAAGPALAADRFLAVRLAHPADATLVLAWDDTAAAPPTVSVAPRPGAEAEFTFAPQSAQAGSTRIVLPADLPGARWLSVAGQDVVLTGAWLERRARPVDVVLIVIDTLRPDYLGCYGGTAAATPAIDGLAADGILFETALCPSPITGPSHASLFTSRLPSVHGVTNNGRAVIPRGMPLLAEILAGCGYQTAAAVSIGPVSGHWGYSRGFDVYDDRMQDLWILPSETVYPRVEDLRRGLGRPGFLWAHFSDPHEPYDAHGLQQRAVEVSVAGRTVATVPTSTYTPTTLTLDLPAGSTGIAIRGDHAFNVRNISARAGDSRGVVLDPALPPTAAVASWEGTVTAERAGPVELVLHLNDRIDSHDLMLERYAREVATSDRFVGMVLDSLRANGRYDESLIILAGDHGEALGSHGYVGHVETLYDAMVRVPLIIKPPRGDEFRPGTRRRDQAALVDVLPTILARLGLPPLPEVRGRDLLAADAEDAETAIFLETHRPEAERDLYGLRTDRAKIIHEPETGSWEFYDLVADPGEQDNLAAAGSAEFVRHRELLFAILQVLDSSVGGGGDVAVDPRTAEMLRSLGY